jgi:Protein of unknown function (DUF2523)
MQWLAAAIMGGLLNIISTLVGKVLVALGLGVATYSGFSATLTWLKTSAVASLMALPPDVVAMLSLMKVGSCISMVSSALIVRLTLQGMQSDTVKGWVKK